MRVIGKGRESLRKFCAVMDLPEPVRKEPFQNHTKALRDAAVEFGTDSMRGRADELLKAAEDKEEEHPERVAVSTDSTWMRRGYSSLYGVQTVIGFDNQKVLDVQVLSKHCNFCKVWKRKLQDKAITQAEFDAWLTTYRDECQIDTTVSSPAMETEAVKLLWARSMDTNKLQYTSYIGDGDSKGYTAVSAMKPYGDVGVEKEECVGHVRKRLGKNLRDLRQRLGKQKLTDGKPIGGRGRLTDKRIDSLQHYYGNSIKQHAGNIAEMKRSIWASFRHSGSTDDHPHHEYCPPGLRSWCGWRRVEAGGPKYTHHDPLPKAVLDELKSVYERLTADALLRRCERSATQNANESLNGLIWTMCPKESFCSKRTVETAVHLAVVTFNEGYEKVSSVLAASGCDVSPSSLRFLKKFDDDRAYHRRRKSSEDEKESRKRRRAIKKGFADRAREEEGETYAAGGF